MIIMNAQGREHYDEVIAFAKEAGLYDKAEEGEFRSLKSQLAYLETYGDPRQTRSEPYSKCELSKSFDLPENSFNFYIYFRNPNYSAKSSDEWKFFIHGGIVYHGPELGWHIHT